MRQMAKMATILETGDEVYINKKYYHAYEEVQIDIHVITCFLVASMFYQKND